MKNFGRYVFSLIARTGAAAHVNVEPIEIALIELGEGRRIALRRLNQKLLFSPLGLRLQTGAPPELRPMSLTTKAWKRLR